jgi:superfamily II DNA helicase RecQ
VNLDPERYEMLKSSCTDRMQKMIDYVSEEDVCRSSYLLEYFGQMGSSDCGTCDICRSGKSSPKKSAVKSEDLTAEITDFINVRMSGTYTLAGFQERFNSAVSAPQKALEILRRLIDLGTVPPPSE